MRKVNILGTEYTVEEKNAQNDVTLDESRDGYCDTTTKRCVIDEMKETGAGMKQNMTDYKNSVKRHEIIHAFLYESGLERCSWAGDEELVDWFAIQFPKIFKVFKELDIL